MSAPSAIENDPLVALEEVSKRLQIDHLDQLDLGLLDTLAFKSAPSKWPSWTDLEICSSTPGNPANRSGVIKAVHDLCSKLDQMLDRPACQTALGKQAVDLHRERVRGLKKKLALLEDTLTPPDLEPLLFALEETYKRLQGAPEVATLDTFVFRSGKPGLFTTWTDLDLKVQTTGTSSKRGDVLAALRDLMSKGEQMLARPASQRALGSTRLKQYQSQMIAIHEKVDLLGDTLSPPNPQPLLFTLEAVSQRFVQRGSDSLENTLDSIAFRPGKPGLFTVWSDLDVTPGKTGSTENRGAVIMALEDLLAKFDGMLTRPTCQKALDTTSIHKYSSMKDTLRNTLEQYKNGPTAPQKNTFVEPFVAATLPQDLQQGRVEKLKLAISDPSPVIQPKIFSRSAWEEAGAVAGGSMLVAMAISIFIRSFAKAIPLVGLLAVVFSFVRRQHRVAVIAKRAAVAKDLYKTAATNKEVLNIFSLLTQEAQTQFLVGLDSEFRECIAQRYPSLKSMCVHIETFLASSPDDLERTNALTHIPKKGLGGKVSDALRRLL